MKIKYLGTAAFEGIPNPFCECEVCKKARRLGGRELRTRSQALIDGELLIDFPGDAVRHAQEYGLSFSGIKNLLITHSHSDHLIATDIRIKQPGFSNFSKEKILNIYGGKSAIDIIDEKCPGARGDYLELYEIHDFQKFVVGGYTVTALKALHDMSSCPFFFIIEKDGKALMYGNDTGYFLDETWDYLAKNPVHLDLVSLDCTAGNDPVMTYDSHMNLNDNIKVKQRLKELGFADEKTIYVTTHFSHNGTSANYCDFAPIAEKSGFLTAYDGMEIEF